MNQYRVTMPIKGELEIYVDADSEAEAIDKANEAYTIDNIHDWEGIESQASADCEDCDKDEEDA